MGVACSAVWVEVDDGDEKSPFPFATAHPSRELRGRRHGRKDNFWLSLAERAVEIRSGLLSNQAWWLPLPVLQSCHQAQ